MHTSWSQHLNNQSVSAVLLVLAAYWCVDCHGCIDLSICNSKSIIWRETISSTISSTWKKNYRMMQTVRHEKADLQYVGLAIQWSLAANCDHPFLCHYMLLLVQIACQCSLSRWQGSSKGSYCLFLSGEKACVGAEHTTAKQEKWFKQRWSHIDSDNYSIIAKEWKTNVAGKHFNSGRQQPYTSCLATWDRTQCCPTARLLELLWV